MAQYTRKYRGSSRECACGWKLSILRQGGNVGSGWKGCFNPKCEHGIHAGAVLHLKAKTQLGGGCTRPIITEFRLVQIPWNVASDMQSVLVQVLGAEALVRMPAFAP